MRVFLFILFFITSVIANDSKITKINIWNNLSQVHSNYVTAFQVTDSKKVESIIDNNQSLYKDIFNNIRFNSLHVSTSFNKYYSSTPAVKLIAKLDRKMKANGIRNNVVPIHRDLFEKNSIVLKDKITSYLNYMLNNVDNKKNGKELNLKKANKEILDLSTFNPDSYDSFFKDFYFTDYESKLSKSMGVIYKNTLHQFNEYKASYYIYKDILEHVINDNESNISNTILEELYVDSLITQFNELHPFVDKVNSKLNYIGVDLGRIVAFLLFALLFFVIGLAINILVIDKINKKFEKKFIEQKNLVCFTEKEMVGENESDLKKYWILNNDLKKTVLNLLDSEPALKDQVTFEDKQVVIYNEKVKHNLETLIYKELDENDETLLLYTAFNKFKLPLMSILLLSSIHVSVLVLYYNIELNAIIVNIGRSLFTVLVTWLLITIFDILALLFLHSNRFKGRITYRGDIVNFIIIFIKIILTIIGIMVILSVWKIDLTFLMTTVGISGAIVAYGTRNLFVNAFSAIKIMMDNSFISGEWANIGGNPDLDGDIISISLGSVKLRNWENGLVTIPNSLVAESYITNWSRRKTGRRIKLIIGLRYDSKNADIENLKKDIYEMLNNNKNIASPRMNFRNNNKKVQSKIISKKDELGIKNSLYVNLVDFGDSSINLMVYTFTKTTKWGEYMNIKDTVMLNIRSLVEKNNLDFAFPSQSIYVEPNDGFMK